MFVRPDVFLEMRSWGLELPTMNFRDSTNVSNGAPVLFKEADILYINRNKCNNVTLPLRCVSDTEVATMVRVRNAPFYGHVPVKLVSIPCSSRSSSNSSVLL
jgi:hypothetical protein